MTTTDSTESTLSAGATVGVLVMAYGTPRHPSEIETYYTDIRRGRPPTPDQLADLTTRYEAIGGTSPLARHTDDQRDAIQHALDELAPGRYEVAIGLKHAEPKIETTIDALAAAGHRRVIALVLAPHYSAMSIGQYLGRAHTAAEPHGIEIEGVESWATEPAYVDFLAAEVSRMVATLPSPATVVFTAHSLPRRVVEVDGDPYPDELLATAQLVSDAAGLTTASAWTTGWQSAGRTEEPWLGPDILEVIDALAAGDVKGVGVCSCGFVADHLEVLYDLDIEARRRADAAGLGFARTASVNADPAVMAALAARIHAAAG